MINFNEHLIKDYASIKKFIMAGNAIFTIKNEKTGNRFTYKFKQNQGNPDVYWVYMLCQSDNTNEKSYKFLGGFSEERKFLHSKAAQIKNNTLGVKSIEWYCKHIYLEDIPSYVNFYHLSHCGRCGKQLTTPDSIINGFGPECLKYEIAEGFVKPKIKSTEIGFIERELFPEIKLQLTEQEEMIVERYVGTDKKGFMEIIKGYGKQLSLKLNFSK